jgi:hypothetical protein
MADESRAQAPPIPQALEHLIQLNVDFQVLVCLGAECRVCRQPGRDCTPFIFTAQDPNQ